MHCIDITGKRFGKLIVLNRVENIGSNSAWLCKCDCGNKKTTVAVRLNNGQCCSCGCLVKETVGNMFRTHGKSMTVEYKLLKDARKRAKQYKREYNIELIDVVIPKICPILNIPIIKSINSKCTNNSPTLDRIDSNKGYVKGNVRVISMRANRLKQDSTVEELERIIMYIKGEI